MPSLPVLGEDNELLLLGFEEKVLESISLDEISPVVAVLRT